MNYFAILVGFLLYAALELAWYRVQAANWMRLSGKSRAEMTRSATPLNFALYTIFILASTIVLAVIVQMQMGLQRYSWDGLMQNLLTTSFIWIGFLAAPLASSFLIAGKSWKLFWIEAGLHGVAWVLLTVLLTIWR